MKIEKITLLYLRNDEHFQFMTDFLNLINVSGEVSLKVKTPLEAWVLLYRQEDEALKKILKSSLTAKIAAADHERDTVFRGLTEANRAALKHFNAATREAAERTDIVLKTYGDVARKPIAEETSAVYNLVKELKDNHAADIEATGLKTWVAELERLNKAVTKLMDERYDETADRTDLVLKHVRAQVDEGYHAITERIDALALLKPNDDETDYDTFIARLNVIIARANDILAQRRGRSEAKKKKEKEGKEGN